MSALVDAAARLAPEIEARREEIEAGRRLPPDLAEAFAAAGLFHMLVPARLGGGEVDGVTMIETIERIARADGSAGWCVMIGATSGLLATRLEPPHDAEVYGDPLVVTGGVFAPRGRAVPVDGGFRVSGRWPFASGCQHCGWLMGGCTIEGEAAPRLMVFPAADVTIIDTWHVSGLRGTGSHDISVDGVFVPAGRAASLAGTPPRDRGPLYQVPVFGLLAAGIAAVSLGVSRTAIDELAALATVKTATGHSRRLAERPAVQAAVAQAEADWRSARALLVDTMRAPEASLEGRAAIRLAATHAAAMAARVTAAMYTAGGGTAIYDGSPLQRCFRDAHVATQHFMVAPATLELTGKVLLGVTAATGEL